MYFFCTELIVNVESCPVRTFTLCPKHVTFTPRFGQLVLGKYLNKLKHRVHFMFVNMKGYKVDSELHLI